MLFSPKSLLALPLFSALASARPGNVIDKRSQLVVMTHVVTEVVQQPLVLKQVIREKGTTTLTFGDVHITIDITIAPTTYEYTTTKTSTKVVTKTVTT